MSLATMRLWKKIALGALGVFALAQLVPSERQNPPVNADLASPRT
jgi:hypothetical protein